MQFSKTTKIAALLAASLFAGAATVHAAPNDGGRNNSGQENACPAGNTSNVNANCTTAPDSY